MKKILAGLEPQNVFNYFEEISQIPRGSGNEKAISDYLCEFAKKLNLEYIQDEFLNVIIKKPATEGYENCPGVILQGHMDMVCEKNKNSDHDFLKDPIKLRVIDNMIYATDTTLGGDNGIAVAYGMAVLASNDIKHPALEVLITADEEAGMTGAANLDTSLLSGKYLLNLDSEEEGYLWVSCAGGNRSLVSLPTEYTALDSESKSFLLEVKGLLGGHSGAEIDKNRANSNKIMGRVLDYIKVNFNLSSVNGGLKPNAIPRECESVISVNKADVETLHAQVSEIEKILRQEYRVSDANISLVLSETACEKVLTNESKTKAIQLLNLIPSGVEEMSADIEGLVETSSNLGVVTTTEGFINYQSATRSSVKTRREYVNNKIQLLADAIGATFKESDAYPAWERAVDSELEKKCVDIYKKLTGKDPVITAIHAGLECGLFLEKMEGCEAISIGPNMYDIHTPDEHMEISSVKNTWDFLVSILESMNK